MAPSARTDSKPAADIDTTPLSSDPVRVKCILEQKSYDTLEHVNGMEPAQLKDLWEDIFKEKNLDRALLAISKHAPHMADLKVFKEKLDERCTAAEAHSFNLTVESLTKSRFWDVAAGFELAKYKRHIQGLISVKAGGGAKKTSKKARTLSPVLTPEPSDDEPVAAAAAAPVVSRRFGFF